MTKFKGLPMPPEVKPGVTILIVDDDPGLLTLMADGLRKLGSSISVHTAKGVEEGERKLLKFMPDLLITDLQLPDGSGVDLCAFCRTERDLSHTKVLAVTGFHSTGGNWKALQWGADEYLRKPFTPQDLREAVKRLLGITTPIANVWEDFLHQTEYSLGGTQ